ncbi:oxidoreductase [Microlunatus ginsengisoli]|uniref:Oxidoreductase n=1 Tax=Microlunatus ginsengisoli TaxID=363863 RepID=A0ABP6ZGD1_9ACTN
MTWTTNEIPEQSGRTFVITGGNSGIGFEAAKVLAGRGARVVLAVRSTEKGDQAAREIGGATEVRQLDLADLASVRAFADGWSGPIDVLINNAGVMAVPLGHTADGFELQFGTNHLGHFALTNLLLPQIVERVVSVASDAHRAGNGFDLTDLDWRRRKYRRWPAYGQSKLANLLFVLELQRRLTAAGSPIGATAAHPGFAATNLQSHTGNARVDRVFMAVSKAIAQTAEGGARPTLFAATADIPGGSYAGPDGRRQRGAPTLVGRSALASDAGLAERLWAASEDLTGVTFPAEALAED